MKVNLFLATMCAFAISCNNTDDNNPTPQNVEGTWRLASVRGGIAGINDEFSDGSIVWTFETGGNISVLNSNTDESKQDLIETGDYVYTFQPNPVTPETCAENIYIDGVSYGCYTIDGNTLTMNQVESDGYEVILKRLPIAIN